MRARPAAFVPAVLAFALLGAGCGGGDDAKGTSTGTPAPGSTMGAGNASSSGVQPGAPTAGNNSGLSANDSLATQIAENPDLRTLSTLLNAAGMTSVLTSGRYTVFAPNNDAFTKLGTQLDTLLQPANKAQLQNILKFHLVKGKIRSGRLTDGRLLTTVQGSRVRVSTRGNQLLIGNSLSKATILTPDAKAKNGMIHTIDAVMRPKAAK